MKKPRTRPVQSKQISRKQQLFIGGGVVVLVASLFGVVALVGNSIDPAKVSNYTECTRTDGSLLQESYPEVCVTKAGQRFTNPDQSVTLPD